MFALLVGCAVIAIRDDIARVREAETEDVLIDIDQCRREYEKGECDPSTRRKAMEAYCVERQKCMNQDPRSAVKTSPSTAKLIAEILNQFVAVLELKTMIFVFVLLFG